jgi:iron complex transport system substrate-binding protein
MRIASLLPSATEIVYALGLGDDLVAVTFECDQPPRARVDNAVVVGGLDTVGLTPGQVDALVREHVAAGTDLYRLDGAALRAQNPDLVLTQDLCHVCALPAQRITDALSALRSEAMNAEARVTTLDPHSLDDVLLSIVTIAAAAGVPARGQTLVDGLRARLRAVATKVSGRARPRVAMLEWVDPPFAAGHWVPDLVTAAGGESVLGRRGGRSVEVSWSALTAADPDVVVVAPCGYDLDAACEQAANVLGLVPPRVPVWAIDADGLVVGGGPRLVDGIEALASVLHPDVVRRTSDGAVRRVR